VVVGVSGVNASVPGEAACTTANRNSPTAASVEATPFPVSRAPNRRASPTSASRTRWPIAPGRVPAPTSRDVSIGTPNARTTQNSRGQTSACSPKSTARDTWAGGGSRRRARVALHEPTTAIWKKPRRPIPLFRVSDEL
jgi:hypothetical protein